MSSSSGSDSAVSDPRWAYRDALFASLGILVVLGAIKHLGQAVPVVYHHGFTIALAFQLYLPLYLVGKNGITHESLGLSVKNWRQDLFWFAVVSVATIVPYAIGLHIYMTVGLGRPFHPRWPHGLIEAAAVNIALVGFAEELYFRGYLQERLTRVWPDRARLAGAPVGFAIVGAAIIFALAHFIGEYVPARLGPFFPGLVFGWLRAKTGTILAAVGYHGFCNMLADALIASYR